jgi:hypothetical protein
MAAPTKDKTSCHPRDSAKPRVSEANETLGTYRAFVQPQCGSPAFRAYGAVFLRKKRGVDRGVFRSLRSPPQRARRAGMTVGRVFEGSPLLSFAGLSGKSIFITFS